MKSLRLLTLFFLVFALGCTDDDNSYLEDGTNPKPNLKITGSSAHGFLSADDYQSVVIEIFYVKGLRPTTQTVSNLKNFMEARLNKPGGISFTETEIESPGKSPYTLDEIVGIEKEIRTRYNSPGVLTLFILFIDGKSWADTDNSFTLGTAYRNTSFVVYEKSVQFLSGNNPDSYLTQLETTVMLHEFCHLLGLVDFGTAMQSPHRDQAHGQHCDNENCLMFWQTENNLLAGSINGIPQLDAKCISDLRANGGK